DVPRLYALAALAEAELAAGNAQEAGEAARSALEIAERLGSVQVGDVLAGRIAVEACIASGREDDARRALDHPLRLLQTRAELIDDPKLRRSMLERVDDHRRLLDLARELSVA